MTENAVIELLRKAVEQKAGRHMRTPKDFEFLSHCIFEECHEMLSTSTLKRIWGYVQSDSTPRSSSLTPLAQYIGYADWEDYVSKQEATPSIPHTKPSWFTPRRLVFILLSLTIVAILLFFLHSSLSNTDHTPANYQQARSGKRVLHKGEDFFRTPEEYLQLFGIEAGDTAYFRPVPGLNHIYVWGPEYGHPVWHNEGDSLKLMPTITEYWTPLPGAANQQSEKYVYLANEKLYYERMLKDELRITFMRDLTPNMYVFLGIYRSDRDLSTPEKFVWRRVSDSLDLGRIDQLDLLRKK